MVLKTAHVGVRTLRRRHGRPFYCWTSEISIAVGRLRCPAVSRKVLNGKMTHFHSETTYSGDVSQMLHGAGIFTYIYPKNDPNVGQYSIHGASGYDIFTHLKLLSI